MEVLGVTSYGDLSQFASTSWASAFVLSIDDEEFTPDRRSTRPFSTCGSFSIVIRFEETPTS